ncbi:uncharacterized protein BXZ73DRAFT_96424 [Epithele typhae]|uniref:uncharacterized protein n=1 Tax=Epithele typhae TaxID=378194 RepID=UPI002007EC29|nr:uncharacterized protein BXZ73DRAFT_96424 [Epithele typhae]KAH9945436.1 hypothetical protein BXZ73DRAFT_96424 [Epithele typhae]
MPAVPSSAVPLNAFVDLSYLPDSSPYDGPTPDPDSDDLFLLPTSDGAAVSQYVLAQVPSTSAQGPALCKPRLELASLVLHSPSSIIGTPFDLSPRFEYPFPPAVLEAALSARAHPALVIDKGSPPRPPAYASALSAFTHPLPPPLPLASSDPPVPPKAKAHKRSFSPKYPAKDPPMPPGLAKRRQMNRTDPDAVAAEQEDAQARGRGVTLTVLTDSLEKASREPLRADRWKRNTLALGQLPQGLGSYEQLVKMKSSQTVNP